MSFDLGLYQKKMLLESMNIPLRRYPFSRGGSRRSTEVFRINDLLAQLGVRYEHAQIDTND